MGEAAVALTNDRFKIEIRSTGGCLAGLDWRSRRGWLPLMRRAPEPRSFSDSACWPMAPYCGRVAAPDGRPGVIIRPEGEFAPRDERLRESFAIHGAVCRLPWLLRKEGNNAILECADRFFPEEWGEFSPFKFSITTKYRLLPEALVCETKLTNTGCREMPAGCGFHPFWLREPSGAPERPQLMFAAAGLYEKTGGILLPAGEPRLLPAQLDFSAWRDLPDELDHGFVGLEEALRIRWPASRIQVDVLLSPPFKHLVLYSPVSGADQGSFAAEWQTCAPNAYALQAAGVQSCGLARLSPGESLVADWRLSAADFGD